MPTVLIVLIVILCLYALLFEFSNGFHDTANAVATVIYTRALKPRIAVLRSWLRNMIGVLVWWLTVAYSISHLFPLDALIQSSVLVKTAFFLAILLSALLWNLYTRWRAIPCSSMHALVGSVIGVSVGYAFFSGFSLATIPWEKLQDVGLSLLISPLLGFVVSMFAVASIKYRFPRTKLFQHTATSETPPWKIRATLISTCTAVSFAHGSNDWQKGVWILMAILIVFLPTIYSFSNVPFWVVGTVGWVLGLWTIVGRKKIVETLGTKIGKHPMTYGEWAVAEMVTALTIVFSSFFGLPVSTTHVLSSWVAWTMASTWWMKNLQMETVKSIAIAWIITLPITIMMWFILYSLASRYTT